MPEGELILEVNGFTGEVVINGVSHHADPPVAQLLMQSRRRMREAELRVEQLEDAAKRLDG